MIEKGNTMGGTAGHYNSHDDALTIEDRLRNITHRVAITHHTVEALMKVVAEIQHDVALLTHRAKPRSSRGTAREKRP